MYIGCEKYLIAVVIFISLIPNNIEHFFHAGEISDDTVQSSLSQKPWRTRCHVNLAVPSE